MSGVTYAAGVTVCSMIRLLSPISYIPGITNALDHQYLYLVGTWCITSINSWFYSWRCFGETTTACGEQVRNLGSTFPPSTSTIVYHHQQAVHSTTRTDRLYIHVDLTAKWRQVRCVVEHAYRSVRSEREQWKVVKKIEIPNYTFSAPISYHFRYKCVCACVCASERPGNLVHVSGYLLSGWVFSRLYHEVCCSACM